MSHLGTLIDILNPSLYASCSLFLFFYIFDVCDWECDLKKVILKEGKFICMAATNKKAIKSALQKTSKIWELSFNSNKIFLKLDLKELSIGAWMT